MLLFRCRVFSIQECSVAEHKLFQVIDLCVEFFVFRVAAFEFLVIVKAEFSLLLAEKTLKLCKMFAKTVLEIFDLVQLQVLG